jgi:hypothetical protein
MNQHRDTEQLLDAWMRDGPTVAPDRVLDVVVDRIERQRQRPAWRLDWRRYTMNSSIKLAAAALAVVIVALIGYNLLPGSTGVGGPGPSASPTPTPGSSTSPSASAAAVDCEDQLPGCEGPLAAGVHHTKQFAPGFSYETTSPVLGAWLNVIDLPAIMKIDQGNPNDPYALLWSDAAITDQTGPCSADPDPARGRRAADWIAFLTSHPGLVASEPVSVDFGGITGQQVELAVKDTWTATCPNHSAHYVTLLTQPVQGRPSEYGLGSDGRLLFTVVDVGTKTVVIQSYGPLLPTLFTSATAPVRQLISTFRFD